MYGKKAVVGSNTLEQQCLNFIFEYNILSEDVEDNCFIRYQTLIEDNVVGTQLSLQSEQKLAKIFGKKLPKNTELWDDFVSLTSEEPDDTVFKTVVRIKSLLSDIRAIYLKAQTYCPVSYVFHQKAEDKPHRNYLDFNSSTQQGTKSEQKFAPEICETCGNTTHLQSQCLWKGHQFANNTAKAWKNSDAAALWKQSSKGTMTPNVTISGIMVKFPTRDPQKQSGHSNQSGQGKSNQRDSRDNYNRDNYRDNNSGDRNQGYNQAT